MRVQNKIILLLAVAVAVFAAGLATLGYMGEARHEQLFNDLARDKGAEFDSIVTVKGGLLESFANDYSYWDEMVRFVDIRDVRWAYDNIETALPIFHADAAWVLRPDCSLIYSTNAHGYERLKACPLPGAALEKLFARNRFPHFFINSYKGPLEIRGAPIQPVADYKRKTAPKGYFLAGRLWDKGYIGELAVLTGGSVDIHPAGGGLIENGYDKKSGAISFSKDLPDWQGKPLLRMHIENRFPMLKEEEGSTNRDILMFLGFALVVLIVLYLFLRQWVGRPLQAIARGMDAEDPLLIDGLRDDDTEFGRLAQTIHRSFEHKKEMVREVSERRRSEEALRESESKFRTLVESSLAGVYIIQDGRPVYVNPRLADMFGYTMEEASGLKSVAEVVLPEDWPRTAELIGALISGEKENVRYEFRGVRKNNTVINVEAFSSRTFINGQPAVIGTLLDITDRTLAEDMRLSHEQHLDFLAHHDGLTGLPNRSLFSDLLEQAIASARRHKKCAAVMMLDMDQFKVVNDTLGHAAGDKLLMDMAGRLKGCLRESDTVARFGGDEFCIIISDIERDGYAATVAQKIIESCRAPFDLDGHATRATLSIGIAVFPSDGQDSRTLLKHADIALYRAKEKGRDNYHIFAKAA